MRSFACQFRRSKRRSGQEALEQMPFEKKHSVARRRGQQPAGIIRLVAHGAKRQNMAKMMATARDDRNHAPSAFDAAAARSGMGPTRMLASYPGQPPSMLLIAP